MSATTRVSMGRLGRRSKARVSLGEELKRADCVDSAALVPPAARMATFIAEEKAWERLWERRLPTGSEAASEAARTAVACSLSLKSSRSLCAGRGA